MGFDLAFLICAVGTAGLFYLSRGRSLRVSKAMWLPVIWFWIIGSRPASAWITIWTGITFGGAAASSDLYSQADGSPMDAAIFAALLVAGIVILLGRVGRARALLKSNAPILIFYAYCLSSIFWSHIPEIAIKRWIKDLGDVAMALIIATDPEPSDALQALFCRVGFILLPSSVLLIRYSALGHAYDPGGDNSNTGVTTNKNSLGLITYVVAIGAVWTLIQALRDKKRRSKARKVVAVAILVAFGFAVLAEAHSATAIACFTLGSMLVLATHLPVIRRNPAGIHVLVLTLLLVGGAMMLFGGEATVVGALGRDTTLTGRTEIWAVVIPMCPNSMVGAGFESFWNTYGGNLAALGRYEKGLNEAHNGYIEVYLNLGWIGIGFIGLILFRGYMLACAAFRRNREIGSLMLAYVATCAIYGVSEAGFRILTPTWIFLLITNFVSARYLLAANRGHVHQRTTWLDVMSLNRELRKQLPPRPAVDVSPVLDRSLSPR